MKPRLLDLFCGAGGAAMGYSRAGFEVVGVDIKPQPNYPFEFHWQDALRVLSGEKDYPEGPAMVDQDAYALWAAEWRKLDLSRFAAIHASPPCQAHSTIGKQARGRDATLEHLDLVGPTRELLTATELPYVIENVVGAPLLNPAMLCGSWFGLELHRHRLFEASFALLSTPCSHHWQKPRYGTPDKRRGDALASAVPVFGTGRQVTSVDGVAISMDEQRALWQRAMGIDWMNAREINQAIPPAYTELIGHQLLAHIKASVAA